MLFSALLAAFDPTSVVDAFVGTSGTKQGGPIDTFPGADVPFGMLQWSPDTPSQNAGGGYEYGDTQITGFSLTHLSGPGCSVFGDFAFLPTVGPIADPSDARDPFSHKNERASPGSYDVTLDSGIATDLTVTQRTGIGRFTFPSSTQGNLLVNASSDQAGVTDANVAIVGDDEVTGSATTGEFCGMPDQFVVYFAAEFDHPFSSYGTWRGGSVAPGSRGSSGAGSGAWVTFDTSHDATVTVKVSISYVSVRGALTNIAAEDRGWNLDAVREAALQKWRAVLSRIEVDGGSAAERTTFYTALYHAMLHPNVFSDADGLYRGFDGRVHRVRRGHEEYANYSDWDIYRSEMPLVALLDPQRASDMMASLVDAAHEGGFLPRWALVNGPTSVMGGDSVDVVLAGGYAFGARSFDVHGAVAAMVRGATTTSPREDGWYVERPELAEYERLGYIVNTHTTSVAPVPNGASETLEYALDDFSIAQLASEDGEAGVARTFLRRSSTWANLFDTSTDLVAPRDDDGAFMHTTIGDAGESGFQEGNAAQYSWNVPQDLRDLIAGMGGAAAVRQRLDTFFTQLNAGQSLPYAWLGNEPCLGSPWVYLSAGAPWRAQEVVRDALLQLYGDSPVGLPGNDDLGEMSAWYVWSAIGLYPQNPAVRFLDIGSPLFKHVVVTAPNGPTITIDAPQASDGTPYVQALSVDGRATERTYLDLPLHGSANLDFVLGTTPNERWGAAPSDAPPSFGASPVRFPPSSAVSLSLSPSLLLTFTNDGDQASSVTWHASETAGSRTTVVAAHGRVTVQLEMPNTAGAARYESVRVDATANGATLEHAATSVRVGDPRGRVPLAFLENIYDNSVTPIDLSTGAMLPKIAVGDSPRDGVVAANGDLYVTDRDGASISVLDPATLALRATIKAGQGPSGIIAAPDGTLWFVNAYDGTVQSIDPANDLASAPIPIGGTLRALAIVGSTLYVTVSSLNEVLPVDVRTHAFGTPIEVGRQPEGIVASRDGTMLYVVDHASNDVTPIDVATHRALAPIGVGVAPENIVLAPDDRTAYVTNYGVDTVTPIDLVRRRAGRPIRVGAQPYGLAMSADGRTLWVVNHEDNDLVPVDTASGRAGAAVVDPYGPTTITLP